MTAITLEIAPTELVSALKAVLPHASTDTTIPGINAVRLSAESGNVFLTATDRYTVGKRRVARVDDKVSVDDFTVVLSLDTAKAVLRVATGTAKHVPYLIVTVDDGKVNVNDLSTSATFPLADVAFPNLDSILESRIEAALSGDPSTTDSTGYNPKYLARFEKAAASKWEVMALWPTTGTKPRVVTVGDDFLGLIMGVRAPNGGTYAMPAWAVKAAPLVDAVA